MDPGCPPWIAVILALVVGFAANALTVSGLSRIITGSWAKYLLDMADRAPHT